MICYDMTDNGASRARKKCASGNASIGGKGARRGSSQRELAEGALGGSSQGSSRQGSSRRELAI